MVLRQNGPSTDVCKIGLLFRQMPAQQPPGARKRRSRAILCAANRLFSARSASKGAPFCTQLREGRVAGCNAAGPQPGATGGVGGKEPRAGVGSQESQADVGGLESQVGIGRSEPQVGIGSAKSKAIVGDLESQAGVGGEEGAVASALTCKLRGRAVKGNAAALDEHHAVACAHALQVMSDHDDGPLS